MERQVLVVLVVVALVVLVVWVLLEQQILVAAVVVGHGIHMLAAQVVLASLFFRFPLPTTLESRPAHPQ
jgi:uncharacterized membrane protein YqjE